DGLIDINDPDCQSPENCTDGIDNDGDGLVDLNDPDCSSSTQIIPSGINRIDADLSPALSGNGIGVVNADIAIIDSGIDNHKDLNIFLHRDFISGSVVTAPDKNGHGTHVAGIAAAKDDKNGVVGVAPGARLWNLKVLDAEGSGSISNVIKAIDYATLNSDKIEVINLSLGCQCSSSALDVAIDKATNSGITVVAAAGNEAIDAKSFSPANHPKVITVSAISDSDGKCGSLGSKTNYGNDDSFATFSNFGNLIEIAAPGVNIYSTYKGDSYATLSGTSMATPYVAGSVALYKELHPEATPEQVKNIIRNLGTTSSTLCDGKGRGYFTADKDTFQEPMLYIRNLS
ncbi:MAG: S8 family serine peptidase, partial [Nitrososphaeraceae archaeon]